MTTTTIGQRYAMALYCLVLAHSAISGGLVTALSGAVRLPMEVFGSNTTTHDATTHHNGSAAAVATATTSLETRKAVLRQKVLLMSSYGSADGSGVQQPAGLDRLEEQLMDGSSGGGQQRVSETVHGARILYQIGTSEADLPICAPNAVCSKIDLYETPWIERQCRCPKLTAKHSHNSLTINHPKNPTAAKSASSSSSQITSDPYHMFLEQQRRKLAQMAIGSSDYPNGHEDDQHLKTLLRKLGVLYNQDDIVVGNENENEASNGASVNGGYRKTFPSADSNAVSGYHDTKRMRHSVHRMDMQRMGGCPNTITTEDGHTLADKTRYYKLCEPIHKLPQCRYFKDWVWTLKTSPDMNVTEQIVHCRCPKGAVTYLIRRDPLPTGVGFAYLFACSPQSRLRCQRKEPCKLFTVRKRQEFLDEVNTNPLCQCPRNHHCPSHHMDAGVLVGKSYIEDNIRTYSGFCMPDDRKTTKTQKKRK